MKMIPIKCGIELRQSLVIPINDCVVFDLLWDVSIKIVAGMDYHLLCLNINPELT